MKRRHMTLMTRILWPRPGGEEIGAPAWRAGREIQRPQQPLVLCDIGNDLALVPGMVAGGDTVDAGGVQLGADLSGDAEARSGVLAIDHDEIELLLLAQLGHFAQHRVAAGAADDVAAEQYLHRSDKGASLPLGQQPIEPLVGRAARYSVHTLALEADANRRHAAPHTQIRERTAIEAASIAQAPAVGITGQQRHDQRIGLDRRPRPLQAVARCRTRLSPKARRDAGAKAQLLAFPQYDRQGKLAALIEKRRHQRSDVRPLIGQKPDTTAGVLTGASRRNVLEKALGAWLDVRCRSAWRARRGYHRPASAWPR